MSRRVEVPLYHAMIDRLLGQYENLCVDFSWIVFDTLICSHGHAAPAWLALTEKYADRIVLGSDLVAKFERLGPEMQRHDAFLRCLTEPTRRAVCVENAERIYGTERRAALPRLPAWSAVAHLARPAATGEQGTPDVVAPPRAIGGEGATERHVRSDGSIDVA
jgi:hypothetical protein